jgi:hypothetical protein
VLPTTAQQILSEKRNPCYLKSAPPLDEARAFSRRPAKTQKTRFPNFFGDNPLISHDSAKKKIGKACKSDRKQREISDAPWRSKGFPNKNLEKICKATPVCPEGGTAAEAARLPASRQDIWPRLE